MSVGKAVAGERDFHIGSGAAWLRSTAEFISVATTAIFSYLRSLVTSWLQWARQKLLHYFLAQWEKVQQEDAAERASIRNILLKVIHLLEEGEEEEALEEDPEVEPEVGDTNAI